MTPLMTSVRRVAIVEDHGALRTTRLDRVRFVPLVSR